MDQNNNSYQNGSKTSSSFKIIISIVCILLFLSGILFGYFIGIKINLSKGKDITTLDKKDNTTNDKDDSEYVSVYKYIDVDIDKLVSEPKQKNDVINNIKIEKVFKIKNGTNDDESTLYFLVKNNNSVAVNVDFSLNYYDSEGYNIDHSSESMQMVGPGNEFVIDIRPDVKKDRDVKSYKLVYNATKEKSYDHYVDVNEKDFKVTDTEREFSISYTNNTGKEIQYGFNAALILYKGNDIVLAQNVFMGSQKLANGASAVGTVYKYRFEDIKYDRYKIVKSSAYYQDKEW